MPVQMKFHRAHNNYSIPMRQTRIDCIHQLSRRLKLARPATNPSRASTWTTISLKLAMALKRLCYRQNQGHGSSFSFFSCNELLSLEFQFLGNMLKKKFIHRSLPKRISQAFLAFIAWRPKYSRKLCKLLQFSLYKFTPKYIHLLIINHDLYVLYGH